MDIILPFYSALPLIRCDLLPRLHSATAEETVESITKPVAVAGVYVSGILCGLTFEVVFSRVSNALGRVLGNRKERLPHVHPFHRACGSRAHVLQQPRVKLPSRGAFELLEATEKLNELVEDILVKRVVGWPTSVVEEGRLPVSAAR